MTRMGANMRQVIDTMETLGLRLGRPPFLPEILDALPDLTKVQVAKALRAAVEQGNVTNPCRGGYVLAQTSDSRTVEFDMSVGARL